MTVLDDVADLIKQVAPDAICDDCISERLKLTVRQHANIKTRELANRPGYRREKGHCFACGSSKKVIQAE